MTAVASSDSDSASSSRARLQVLALACSLSLLTYLDRICIARVQPDIERDLGLTDIEMGFVFSAFTAGYAVFLLPVGWLADMWGPRRVILRIVLWWSLFTALTGAVFDFFPNAPLRLPWPGGWIAVSWGFVAMLTVRFLFGCGEAGVYPALTTVVRAWFPPSQRALTQGAIFMSARLGAAFAPFIIGRLSHAVGWRLAFVALGTIGIAWSILFARYFRNQPAKQPAAVAEEILTSQSAPDSTEQPQELPWRQALSSPAVWALSLAYVGIGCAWSFFPAWQGRYFSDVYGLSFQDSEIWTGLPFLCGAAGAFAGGRLSDLLVVWTGNLRWARTLVGVFGCAGAAGCILLASVVHNSAQAVALFALASFSNDLVLGPFWATIADIGGRFTGTLAGWFNTVGCIGAMLFVPLIPWLRQQGLEWYFVLQIMACIWAIAAVAWLSVDTTRPIVAPDAANNSGT